jgi:hypothetical protein
MPPFGSADSGAERAAVATYIIAHFGGKTGRVTPEDFPPLHRWPSTWLCLSGAANAYGRYRLIVDKREQNAGDLEYRRNLALEVASDRPSQRPLAALRTNDHKL